MAEISGGEYSLPPARILTWFPSARTTSYGTSLISLPTSSNARPMNRLIE